jgi:hypothetical protein
LTLASAASEGLALRMKRGRGVSTLWIRPMKLTVYLFGLASP